MKTPIEKMLDGVHWREADGPPEDDDGTPWATHEGVMDIMGHKLRCYRLNTGQAIINADDMHDFFGGELRSNTRA
jgi:hypothetical protein